MSRKKTPRFIRTTKQALWFIVGAGASVGFLVAMYLGYPIERLLLILICMLTIFVITGIWFGKSVSQMVQVLGLLITLVLAIWFRS